MILYFTGTGNSEYVATEIGKITGDTVVNLFDRIKNNDYQELHSDNAWTIVAPIYAWQIPHILRDWLSNTPLGGSKDIRFVLTCGGSMGNADKYLRQLCDLTQMNYIGCAQVVMPENYIALFSTPTQEEALRIINAAQKDIKNIANLICNNSPLPLPKRSVMNKINSSIINDFFYPLFVRDKKFYATRCCISCSLCVKVCPLNNIILNNGKPVWQNNCTHCMACICQCPTEAIEYGKHSVGQPRYICPK